MSKLRKIRNERGLFQTIVADCVGVTSTTLLGWEKLKTFPTTRDLRALADVYNVPISDLVEDEY